MSSLDIPVHLALVLLLANGAPLPSGIDRDVLAAKPEVRRVARPGLGFTEARWIAAVARHGERSGLGDLSRRIFRTSSGRLYTPVETDRRAILALMADPAVAARVASEAARSDAAEISAATGRTARTPELYAAYLIGIDAAVALARSADKAPDTVAAELAPAAALTEPGLFFLGRRPRTAAEVIAEIEAALQRALPLAGRDGSGAAKAGLAAGQRAREQLAPTTRS